MCSQRCYEHRKRANERYYRGKAIEYFEMAWQEKEIPQEIEAIFLYLIAELHRRLGGAKKSHSMV